MRVEEVVERMNLQVLTDEVGLQNEIVGGYCGDLLSFVMAHVKEKALWMTVQGHINTVAVASLTGVSCIVLTEGVQADRDMLLKAKEEGIAVVATPLSSFDFTVAYSKKCL